MEQKEKYKEKIPFKLGTRERKTKEKIPVSGTDNN